MSLKVGSTLKTSKYKSGRLNSAVCAIHTVGIDPATRRELVIFPWNFCYLPVWCVRCYAGPKIKHATHPAQLQQSGGLASVSSSKTKPVHSCCTFVMASNEHQQQGQRQSPICLKRLLDLTQRHNCNLNTGFKTRSRCFRSSCFRVFPSLPRILGRGWFAMYFAEACAVQMLDASHCE